jgi:hypothetical protein
MKKILILFLFLPFLSWGENMKTFTSKPYCFYKMEPCLKLRNKFRRIKVPNARYEAKCVQRAHSDCPGRNWLLFVKIHVSMEKTLSP